MTPGLRALGTCAALLVGWSAGCGGGSSGATIREPLTVGSDWQAATDDRVEAVREAWRRVDRGEADHGITRSALDALAWDLKTPEAVRAEALQCLLWDERAEGESVRLVREMLPTEPGRHAVAVMATAAADHGWQETVPALVRSLSRPVEGVQTRQRAEYRALERLAGGRGLDGVVYGVFLDPQTDPGPPPLRLDMRAREAAWALLSDITPDDSTRASLLASGGATGESAVVASRLRAVHETFGVLPRTGEGVRWAVRLADQDNAANRRWWGEASRLVGRGAGGLHELEPMRWASEHRPAWASASREGLLETLEGRLGGRTVYSRMKSIEGVATANAERLSRQADLLTRGDLLTLLVVDEALSDERVLRSLFAGADADHADGSSEHGGLLFASGEGFGVQAFVPRGAGPGDDRQFVAPRDMIDRSDTSLAHFHYHVSSWRNRDYAGPSPADLEYAARFERACLVLTSLSRDSLNADVYFPSGAVVDLGAVERPATGR